MAAGRLFIYQRYLENGGISMDAAMWQHWPVARMTRETSKAMTRERLLDEARRLFRERGYAATSLEQIAEAAGVTKGAIYGHFSSKEDLLISAIDAAPTPSWATELNDQSLPLRERLADFSRVMATDEEFRDKAVLAMELEFLAALLRSPDDLRRYSAVNERRLAELAEADHDQPLPGTAPVEVWAIGHALFIGLCIYQHIAPDILTPAVFERASALIAGLYPEA
jgi:AcrR family transcriptional regulator